MRSLARPIPAGQPALSVGIFPGRLSRKYHCGHANRPKTTGNGNAHVTERRGL